MTDIIQLKRGQYKGVDIVFIESDTTGGNRLIKFQYPGSDNQSIEYQGKARRSFTMTIWIPHTDYYSARESILRVLEDGAKGTFVHPTFGAIENVIPGRYTLTERNSELGRASISVTFEIDDGDGIPVQSGALASQVQEQAEAVETTLLDDLAETFEVTLSNRGNYQDAIDQFDDLVKAFKEAVETVTLTIDQVAEISQEIKNFANAVTRLIQTPQDLVDRIDDIFVSFDSFFDESNSDEAVRLFNSLFNFGSDDTEIIETTVGLIERKKNRDAVRITIQSLALAYSYANYARIDYETTDDLDTAQETLETQFVSIRTDGTLTNEAQEQLDRLRVQSQKTFDAARVTTPAIVAIEVDTPTPLSVLAYRYYGSTDLVDTLAALNRVEENAFIEGDFNILTVV